MMTDHLLTGIIFWPLIAGLLTLAMGRDTAKWWALFASIAELIMAVVMVLNLQPTPAWQFEDRWVWLLPLGVTFHVAVDGISGFLVLAAAVLAPLGILSAFGLSAYGRGFYFWLLAFETGMIGALVSLDLLVFYVFWELMLLPAFFLIGIWGGKGRVPATVKFALMTLVGSLTMLLAILYLGVRVHDATGAWSFDYGQMLNLKFGLEEEVLLFLAFLAAFAVKIPLFPLHPWLPGAYTEAPTAAVLMMSGVMAKLGIYGLLRFAIPLFPHTAYGMGPFLMILAVIGIVYGALVALGQGDAKKVIAYSSFSHLGWVALGLFALNVESVTGGVFQMLSHAVSTGVLFLLVGMLWERHGSTAIADFGGIARTAPWLATAMVIAAMASMGLPGLNGFVGEFMILLGAWSRSPLLAAIGGTGVVLGAAYLLFLLQKMLFGPVRERHERMADLGWREAVTVLPLLAATVVMGVWPGPILERIEPSTRAFVTLVEARRMQGVGAMPASTAGRPRRLTK